MSKPLTTTTQRESRRAKPAHRSKKKKHTQFLLMLFSMMSLMCLMVAGLVWLLATQSSVVSIELESEPDVDFGTDSATAVAGLTSTSVDPPRSVMSESNRHRPQAANAGQSLSLDLPPEMEDWGAYQESWHDYQYDGVFESDEPVHAHNSIDDQVFGNLIKLGIQPAKLCSDEVFLRRVYVDVLGTLPTVQEAKRFLDDSDIDKRAKLIDELLERPELADYLAMKWCDLLRVKAEFPINLWPNAAQAYHHWIHTAIKNNMPYDEFATELLTASGSNFRTPQVNFYRAMQSQQPKAIAQAVALTFMCERTEKWSTERLEGMAQFFSKVGYKPTGEWKEEIVFFDARGGETASPSEPIQTLLPNGASYLIPAGQDPRVVFAKWLTHDKNPWFARAISNRIWYWLVGRGIVDPVDDVGLDNPPSNLGLLNLLADELIAANYDIKQLYRLILDSSAYQLACVPQSDDPRAGDHFAFYHARRHDAEVLIDAICQITGTTETYMSIIPEPFTFLPDFQRAILLPDGSITSSFLETFGRPARDSGLESERNNRLTAGQALHLLNSNHIRNKIKSGPALQALIRQGSDARQTAELLYLGILSRRPTENEQSAAEQLCTNDHGAKELAWALINSDEFLFRH